MSTIDALRSHNDPENEGDFFQTLPCQVRCLAEFLQLNEQSVLDAGSGRGVISDILKMQFPYVDMKTSEINSETHKSEILEFSWDEELPRHREQFPTPDYGDFLQVKDQFDIIVSNPPYSLKDEFITHALELARTDVFMLFPLQILNYIEICENWMDNPKYCGRITMYPKVILNQEGDYIQGGNTGYGWFHFSNRPLIEDHSIDKYEVFMDIRKYK